MGKLNVALGFLFLMICKQKILTSGKRFCPSIVLERLVFYLECVLREYFKCDHPLADQSGTVHSIVWFLYHHIPWHIQYRSGRQQECHLLFGSAPSMELKLQLLFLSFIYCPISQQGLGVCEIKLLAFSELDQTPMTAILREGEARCGHQPYWIRLKISRKFFPTAIVQLLVLIGIRLA